MAIARKQVIAALHAGIRTASRNYKRWSGGLTLKDSGVEGLIAVEIARKIHGNQSKPESLRMEMPFKTVIKWSGARAVGRTPRSLDGGRPDIVLLNGDLKPVCVIEVKRDVVKETMIVDDLVRLRDVLRRCSKRKGGTLKRAFLAVYHQGQTKGLCSWIDGFFDDNRKKIACRSCKVERFKDGVSIHVEITDGQPHQMQACCWL